MPPQQALRLLPDFLLTHASPHVEGNSLVAHGSNALLTKLRNDLARLDQPPPLLELELLAVETLDRKELSRGLTVRWERPDGTVAYASPDSVLTLEKVGVLPHSFSATLAALEERHRARLWDRARVLVLNGNQARLFVGRRRFIEVVRGGWQLQPDLQSLDIGTVLRVTPWTGDEKTIVSKVAAEVSELVTGAEGNTLPIVARRELSSTLRTVSGETVLIGGLRLRQSTLRRGRYPVLSTLPLVGAWFTPRHSRREETELVFFLTPRVVDPAQVGAEALQELRKWLNGAS